MLNPTRLSIKSIVVVAHVYSETSGNDATEPGHFIKVRTSWLLLWFSISSEAEAKNHTSSLQPLNTFPLRVCLDSKTQFSLNSPKLGEDYLKTGHLCSLHVCLCVPP